jgi:hypothetical protein
MVSVLASSAVDQGLKLGSGKTKDYKIGICCFSTKHVQATCLPADCCVFQWGSTRKIKLSV